MAKKKRKTTRKKRSAPLGSGMAGRAKKAIKGRTSRLDRALKAAGG